MGTIPMSSETLGRVQECLGYWGVSQEPVDTQVAPGQPTRLLRSVSSVQATLCSSAPQGPPGFPGRDGQAGQTGQKGSVVSHFSRHPGWTWLRAPSGGVRWCGLGSPGRRNATGWWCPGLWGFTPVGSPTAGDPRAPASLRAGGWGSCQNPGSRPSCFFMMTSGVTVLRNGNTLPRLETLFQVSILSASMSEKLSRRREPAAGSGFRVALPCWAGRRSRSPVGTMLSSVPQQEPSCWAPQQGLCSELAALLLLS